VSSFDKPPRYQDFPDPVAAHSGELVVDVVAAALHPRVRSQANGSHYRSTGELPLVPGIDAVVRDAKGKLYYTILDDTTLGTMAQQTVIEKDRSVALPKNADPVTVAAAMNPVMSSWVALRHRINVKRGSRVLILGATGNAGRMAIQVVKRFGAKEVIGAGRNPKRLNELTTLGVDRVLTLDQLDQASDVDVVLDYVWGEPTAKGMVDLLTHRRDRGKELIWIEIGSMAGPGAEIISAALRSTRIQIVGSGIGSVSGHDFRKEVPAIAHALSLYLLSCPGAGHRGRLVGTFVFGENVDTSLVAFGFRPWRAHESVDDSQCFRNRVHTPADTDQLRVVVFTSQRRGLNTPRQRASRTDHLVGGDLLTVT
jgi:NADPH:quinone reductase-like Zn-dependent oxidoreductase